MNKDTVFLTGGTGFLGRNLVAPLLRQGYALRILTRYPQEHIWLNSYPDVQVVYGDLRDSKHVTTAMAGCRYVIHAAGLFSMWDHAGNFDAINVQGTQHIADAALACDIERLVYVSTIAVIGNPPSSGVITEETPVHPADAYQKSKLEAEHVLLRSVDHGLGATIVRAGAFYGPFGDYAFNRLFFRDPMRGIVMQMDGGHYEIFPVYIGDVAQGILAALRVGRAGEIYNLCGHSISHRAAFDIIYEQAGIRWPRMNIPNWLGISISRVLTALSTITGQEPFWPLNLRSYVFNDWRVDSQKAKDELGFNPIDFAEGARRTLAWYKAGRPPYPDPSIETVFSP